MLCFNIIQKYYQTISHLLVHVFWQLEKQTIQELDLYTYRPCDFSSERHFYLYMFERKNMYIILHNNL